MPAGIARVVSALSRSPRLREHALLTALFLLGRYLLDVAGIRLNFILDWMFISDPADLRDRLLTTLHHAHGFPPGMNLLTGLLLKLDEARAVANAHALLQLFGLAMVNALYYIGKASSLPRAAAMVLSLAFAFSPPAIYFEHLWIYETPVTALLCVAAALLHRALVRPSFGAWSACFLACALIGWLRSSFHLAWFAVIVALAVVFSGRQQWPRILGAAAGPAALLLALYLKNLIVFGVFGALTWGSGSLATATTHNLPADVRQAWVREGKVSPYAAHSVYAGPREFLPYFPGGSEDPRWPPMLNVLERPSLGTPNYNHWFFLEINRRRRDDALVYLKERPRDYARTVELNLLEFFSLSTAWHPHDGAPSAPHHQHRQALGGWESLYNRIVHGIPFGPWGLYVLAPTLCLAPLLTVWSLRRDKEREPRARVALLVFCLLQLGYVTVTGVLVAAGEAARYRFQIDPFIWLMAALSVQAVHRRIAARRGGRGTSPYPAPPPPSPAG